MYDVQLAKLKTGAKFFFKYNTIMLVFGKAQDFENSVHTFLSISIHIFYGYNKYGMFTTQ